MSTYVYLHEHLCIFTWALMYIYMSTYVYFHEHLCIFTWALIHIYMSTYVYLPPYLAHFFLECDMSQVKVAERNRNTGFMFNNIFFLKSCRL
jgi:hypothetical protein